MKRYRLVSIWITMFFLFLGMYSLPLGAEQKRFEGVTLKIAAPRLGTVEIYVKTLEKAAEELGMKVETAWFAQDAMITKILYDTSLGMKTWDIVEVPTGARAAFVEAGSIEPVEKYINDSTLSDPEVRRYVEEGAYLADTVVSDGFWGPEGVRWTIAPLTLQSNALVYRTDLFESPIERRAFKRKYGYELQPPRTYEQMRDISEFFTRKKGETLAGEILKEDFYGNTISGKPGTYIFHDFVTYAANFGYREQLFDRETLMPNWDSPVNKLAVEYWKSMFPFFPPGALTMTSGESFSWFNTGKVAMTIDFMGQIKNQVLSDACKITGKWDMAKLPTVKGLPDRWSLAAGDSFAIYALSEQKEAAYKLLEKVNTFEYQKRLALEHTVTPVLKPVLDDPEVQEKRPLVMKFAKFMAGQYLFTDPPMKEFGEMMDIVSVSLAQALTGEETVDVAFTTAQDKLVEVLKREGYIE